MKLCIIAQPKTASTSLMHAVGEVTGLSYQQCFYYGKSSQPISKIITNGNRFLKLCKMPIRLYNINSPKLRECFPSVNFPALATLHSDIANLPPYCNKIVFSSEIHKQHFPPTKNNIQLLHDIPKVILVRPPKETIEAYQRVPSLSDEMKHKLTEETFCQKLEEELNAWQEGWLSQSRQDKSVIVVSKEDIVNRPVDVLRKIANLINIADIEIPSNYCLPKNRFYHTK